MKTIVDSYGAAVNAHNWAEVREFYSPDLVLNDEKTDPDAVIARLVELTTEYPDWRWEVRHSAFNGDLVLALLRCTGTHKDTGRRVEVREFAHYRVVGNQITEAWISLEGLQS